MTHSLTLGSLVLTDSLPDPEHGYWFEVAAEGTSFGTPEAVLRIVASLLSDGAIVSYDSDGNRVIPIRVRVNGSTLNDVAQGEAALRRESKVSNELTWQPPDNLAPPSVYETHPSPMSLDYSDGWDLDELRRRVRTVRLDLTCSPFARSAEPVTVEAMAAGTTTVTVDSCDSTTGWSGTRSGSGSPALGIWTGGVGVVDLDSAITSPETWTLTRTGTVDLSATPYLVVEARTVSPTEQGVEARADGVVLPLLSARALDSDGWTELTYLGSGSVSELTFTHTSGLAEPWQGLIIREMSRSDVPPGPTSRQVTRVIEVGGTERTPASIKISARDGVSNLGLTILHTSPEDWTGNSPSLRNSWRTNGNTVTADSTLMSGAWEPLHPDSVGFEVPTSSLPEGPYLLCARLRASTAGTHRIFFTGFTRLPPPNDSVLSGDDDRAEWIDFPVANEWIFVTLGVMTLPTVRTASGMSVVGIQRDAGSAANVDIDEAWLFRIGEDCALTVEDDILSPNLWADSPGQGYPVPTLWMGDDMSTRSNPGSAPRSRGNHILRPEGTTVFVATSGVENPAVSGTFYRRWHTNAAD